MVARIPRIMLKEDLRPRLADDPELVRVFHAPNGAFLIPVESPLFERAVELSVGTSGLRVTPPLVEASPVDLEKSKILRLRPARTVRETMSDNDFNRAALAASPERRSPSGFVTRRLTSVTVSRIKLDPRDFAGVDEWTNAFVVASPLAQDLISSSLRGVSLKPVLGPASSEIAFAGNRRVDVGGRAGCGRRPGDGADTGFATMRWNGCIVYDGLGPLSELDFACTAELLTECLYGWSPDQCIVGTGRAAPEGSNSSLSS